MDEVLCFGDQIALYFDEELHSNFYYMNGLVDQKGGIVRMLKNTFPPNFSQYLFQIQYANQYTALKKFLKESESVGMKDFDYKNLEEKKRDDIELENVKNLTEFQHKVEEEEKNNIKEIQRTNGKPLVYGQHFQLIHIPSRLYLNVERESADIHKDCLKISLKKESSPSSIFQIVPSYKFKVEGEQIRLEDHVKIFSKKFSLFLNVAKGKYFDGRNEVNMSSNSTSKWRIKKYSSWSTTQDVLKAGDVVRIQHKEKDSYLMMNQEEVTFCTSEQVDKYTTHTLFQVEMQDPSQGGPIQNKVKLVHLSSGKYLSMPKEEENKNRSIVGGNFEASSTFVIKSSSNSSITYDSHFTLSCAKIWCHYEAEKLVGSSTFYEDDVFSLKKVDSDEISNLFFVLNAILPIDRFLFDSTSQFVTELSHVTQAFHYLIKFCTFDIKDDDVIKREGIPYPKRQKTLCEKGVLDMAIECVTLPFDKGYLTDKDIVKYKNYAKLIRYVYKFIKLATKDNAENGEYMVKFLERIQSQVEWDPMVTEALVGIIQNNTKLVNSITQDNIQFFVDCFSRSASPEIFVGFLSSLCTVSGKPIMKNQDMIANLLFNKPIDRLDGNLILPFIENSRVFAYCKGKKEDFKTIVSTPSLLILLQEVIHLLGQLCFGKNTKTISIIKNYLGYELSLYMISHVKHDLVPPTLKSNFVQFIVHCHINNNELDVKPLLQLTRKWPLSNSTTTTGSIKGKRSSFVSIGQPTELHGKLRDHVVKFYDDKQFDLALVGQNSFIFSMTNLTKHLIQFGIFHYNIFSIAPKNEVYVKDFVKLITNLFRLLNGKLDTFNSRMMGIERFSETEESRIVCRIRCEILDIFTLCLDIMNENRITSLTSLFRRYSRFDEPCIKQWEHTMKQTDLDYLLSGQKTDLREVLLDLTKYENSNLSTKALGFLFKLSNVKMDLVPICNQLELLVSEKMISIYDNIIEKIAKLRRCPFGQEDVILYEIMTLEKTTCQRILRNLNVIPMVMEILIKINSAVPSEDLTKVHKAVIEFLVFFVQDNQENQTYLYYRYFTTLIELEGGTDLYNLFIAIVFDNSKICAMVEETIIQNIIDLLAKYQHPKLLVLLSHFVSFGKRNQELITTNLLERKKDVIVLFDGEEGIKERNDLISKKDHINAPNGKLCYHIQLLELLAACAKGQLSSVEVKLQYITDIEEIFKHLLDTNTILEIKAPLLKYFDEVYVFIDRQKNEKFDIHSKPLVWKLMNQIISELESFMNRDASITHFYIFSVVIPFLCHYFEIRFGDICNRLHTEQVNTIRKMLTILTNMYSSTTNPSHRNKIHQILTIANQKRSGLMESVPIWSNSTVWREAEPKILQEETVIENFGKFVTEVQPILEKDPDFKLLAAKFYSTEYLEQLVSLLSKISKNMNSNGSDVSTSRFIMMKGLDVLIMLLSDGEEDTQNTFAEKNVPELILELIGTTRDSNILKSCLMVGIALLDGGNVQVQKAIFTYFKNHSNQHFFQSLRQRIRQSILEIKAKRDKRKQHDEFVEIGHIQLILRLLQLFCEGHYLEMQNYIRHQEDSVQSVNLLSECLDYTLALKKYIHYSNVEIGVQCFASLTEFIQGPCVANQLFFNSSPLYFMSNEMLANDFEGKNLLSVLDALRIKKACMILLNSIIGESVKKEIIELMSNSIDVEVIKTQYALIADHVKNPNKIVNKIQQQMNKYPFLYDLDTSIEHVKQEVIQMQVDLAYEYKFLLNFLGQVGGEVKDEFSVASIEVLRENQIELVYFRVPQVCHNLSQSTKVHFVESACNGSTPQEKVKNLLDHAPQFKREMLHTENQKKNLFFSHIIKPWWQTPLVRYLGLGFAFIINLLIFLTFTLVYDASTTIPLPGGPTQDLNRKSDFGDPYSEILFLCLGYIHLVLTILYLLIHVIFYSNLKVKLLFKEEPNELIQRDPFMYYWTYIIYSFSDLVVWFYLVYILFILLALFVSPLFYSVLLFELVYRSKILQNVLKSVQLHWDVLLLTGLLLLATIWCFTALYFNYFNENFFIASTVSNKEFICDTMFRCYISIINYGLRGEGFWEDLFDPVTDVGRFVTDMFFWIFIVLILMNIVFGTILESFAQLRETTEATEQEMTDRCFICDIRKNRFDMRANEGIKFSDHIEKDHAIWNYVYFWVHLMNKDETEFTGMEQYLYNLIKANEILFFPIQRSRILESRDE